MSQCIVLKDRPAGHCHQTTGRWIAQWALQILGSPAEDTHQASCISLNRAHPWKTHAPTRTLSSVDFGMLWQGPRCQRKVGEMKQWSQGWRSMLTSDNGDLWSVPMKCFRVYGFIQVAEMGRMDGETFMKVDWCLPQEANMGKGQEMTSRWY